MNKRSKVKKVYSTSDLPKENEIKGIAISTRELLGITSLTVSDREWEKMTIDQRKEYASKRKNLVTNVNKVRQARKKRVEKLADEAINKVFSNSSKLFV